MSGIDDDFQAVKGHAFRNRAFHILDVPTFRISNSECFTYLGCGRSNRVNFTRDHEMFNVVFHVIGKLHAIPRKKLDPIIREARRPCRLPNR